jgi:phosphoglycolate phosphatase
MRTICFDLDGTLTDPKLGITTSIQHALSELGRPVPAADDLTWCIGPPLLGSLEKLLAGRTEAETALLLYRQHFTEIGIYQTDLYPDIAVALSDLASSGHRMFVATSKPKVFADRIIQYLGLSAYFEAIYGSELDGTRSDKSALLAWMMAQERLGSGTTVMVGDRGHDIIAGRANRMATLGVLYGYGTRAELLHAGADDLCQSPIDLTLHLCA